ncbi:GNAT family N-acetyltransferase [Sphaerisporangium flaviroseum]|uniref:GNAT family N-acetyltransferase n=1 Tax=Sphaerisporangium flaviroseum TaxID=509199 RepID=UPI0031E510E4
MISYVRGTRDGRPWAHMVEVIGPRPSEVLAAQLPGWFVSAPEELCRELVGHGARTVRHAYVLRYDLRERENPPVQAPEGFRFVPCDREPKDVLPAWRAAFPPEHPDHYTRSDEEILQEELIPLFEGRLIGPVLPCASLVVDSDDRVVAGMVVNDWDGIAWIANGFRHPLDAPRGTGAALLRHVGWKADRDGLETLTGTVSHGNPALSTWKRLGFTVQETTMTVLL